jgi:hypothetical protein
MVAPPARIVKVFAAGRRCYARRAMNSRLCAWRATISNKNG